MCDPSTPAFGPEAAAERSAVEASVGTDTPRRDAARAPADPPSGADPATEREEIRTFLDDAVAAAGADGVIVNMSGGLDSTVTAALAVEALGADRVHGLILPRNKIGAPHARDAEALADALGIDHDTVHIQSLSAQLGAITPEQFAPHDDPVRSGNASARLRMTLAYLAANATNRLVCGTTNRSERLLGYVTKHGDGAADLLPIGHLYKTEVRALADELDVPEFVVEKPPTAGFLHGQRDADDLGAPYEVIDAVLRLGVDRGLAPETVAERLSADADPETVTDLLARHRATAHKRTQPATPSR